jgi:spoIIIJ-associated protein
MDKKEIEKVTKTTEKLLSLADIEGGFDVVEVENGEGVEIVLNTKDTGLVIGYHGDTLEGLQLILSLCIAKELGKFIRVSVDAADYKKNRIEWLKNLAFETRERVVSEGQEVAVPELKSWERKIVHLELEKEKDVISESQGEGRDRVLIVKPK